MPWEKSFDVEDALEKATRAFWRHGYEATSMKDLVDCMGIQPGSIYATFGNKKKLFQMALKHYEDQKNLLLADFEKNHTPRNVLIAVFEHIADEVRSDPDNCGCFLINSALEAAPNDKDINRAIRRGFEAFEAFCRRMIEEGQKTGEINADLDPAKTARVLHGLLAGARVLSRNRPGHESAQDIADHVKSILS